ALRQVIAAHEAEPGAVGGHDAHQRTGGAAAAARLAAGLPAAKLGCALALGGAFVAPALLPGFASAWVFQVVLWSPRLGGILSMVCQFNGPVPPGRHSLTSP